jgi:hypothetical protein
MADTKTIDPQESAPIRFWNWLTETQIWTSVFRHGRPNSDRNRVLVMLSNVFLHLHPVRIRKSGEAALHGCMGGLSFFLFLVLTFTGLLLMFTTGRRPNTPTPTSWRCVSTCRSARARCTGGAPTPW